MLVFLLLLLAACLGANALILVMIARRAKQATLLMGAMAPMPTHYSRMSTRSSGALLASDAAQAVHEAAIEMKPLPTPHQSGAGGV